MPKRTVIIGLDGVPYSLLKDLSGNGVMPNTQSIIENGLFRQMASTFPEISSVAWSSIITGKNPGEHGIFGFTDLIEGTYNLSFPNFGQLKAMPFWKRDNERSVIINVPSTFPASEMNGIHISGFVALDLERSTYPKTMVSRLRELDYRIDVDSSKAHQSMDLFLEDLDKTLKARKKLFNHLWDNEDWQNFMLVFTDTDRLMHFLWSAYEDKNSKYHGAFLDHFKQIDELLGKIIDNIEDSDSLIMLSDHGFERLDKDIYINYFLKREGFLKFQDTQDTHGLNIDYSTQAFALDPARIYINLEGKYPRGSVHQEDKDKVIAELERLFYSLEIDGKRIIKSVHKKEDVYHGAFIEQAPDLVLLANKGFNLKASIKAQKLSDNDIFTGKHTQDDAFLLINKKCASGIIPENPTVSDVVGIMDKLKG